MSWLKNHYALLLVIVVFLFLNNLSHLAGFITAQQKNLFYTGATLINTNDHFFYLSQVEQAKRGHIFIENLYNPIAQNRLWFAPHWYIIGQASNLFHINTVLTYHLFRLLLQIIFILVLYLWVKKIFIQKKQHWWILSILLFTNGCSAILSKQLTEQYQLRPTNLWMPESITFMSLGQGPLLILSQILLLLIFSLIIKAWEQQKINLTLVTAVLCLLLGIIHPYDVPIILIVSGLWFVLLWQQTKNKNIFKYYGLIVLACTLATAYYVWLLQDLSMQQLYQQNRLPSPNLINYLLGFGLISLGSLGALIYFIKKKFTDNHYLNLMIVWALSGWLMVYLPLDFNRRLSNAWHLPLVIISLVLVNKFYKKIPFLIQILFLGAISFMLSIDTLGYIFNATRSNTDINKIEYYFDQDRLAVYQKIKALPLAKNEIIMSRGVDGALLPAFTGYKVYLGHRLGTWQAYEKNEEVRIKWSNKQDLEKWLAENQVAFIFASRENIPEFDQIKWLAQESYIEPLIDNQQFILYQFKK